MARSVPLQSFPDKALAVETLNKASPCLSCARIGSLTGRNQNTVSDLKRLSQNHSARNEDDWSAQPRVVVATGAERCAIDTCRGPRRTCACNRTLRDKRQ